MQKIIILFLLHISTINSLSAASINHLQALSTAYPFGLLTNDFGVLNKDDLKINTCMAEPTKFSEERSTFYPYWQCFESKTANMVCEGNQYDSDEKNRVSWLIVSGTRNGESHEYMARRAMPISSCHLYLKEWRKLIQGEKYICISGIALGTEKDKSGKKNWAWIFDRYKTNKGCDSYFQGTCNLRHQTSKNCKE